MSLEIIETGEVVDPMGKVEAERITTRIADLLDGIADNIDQVIPLIREALTRQAWAALEYNGPSDYISERFSGALQRLSPEVRRPFAAELSAAGMSTRAIAPIVGVSSAQVKRDVAQVAHREPPAASGTTEHGLPTTDRIVGIDGKTYRRPGPAPEPSVIIDRSTGEVTDHQQQEGTHMAAPAPAEKKTLYKGPRGSAQHNAESLDRAVDMLHGICTVLDGVTDISALTDEEAARIRRGFQETIHSLRRIINLTKGNQS